MTDQPITSVEAVAQHYTVTYHGHTARITRYGDRPNDLDPADATEPYLSVEGVDGRFAILAADNGSFHHSDEVRPVELRATFPIGDDLDAALTRATKYAAAMCRVVADHVAAIDKRNETNHVKVQMARFVYGAQ